MSVVIAIVIQRGRDDWHHSSDLRDYMLLHRSYFVSFSCIDLLSTPGLPGVKDFRSWWKTPSSAILQYKSEGKLNIEIFAGQDIFQAAYETQSIK